MLPKRISSMPWYALPETEAAQSLLWANIARRLRDGGVRDVPDRLARRQPFVRTFVDPRLLLGQCCGYDLIYGFASSVLLVATPRFRAPGCDGPQYSSFVIVRDDFHGHDLEALRGSVCAVNSLNSHSGTNALRALVAPLSRDGRFFSSVIVSGAHTRSLGLVRAGRADVMAIDCVLHALLGLHRPASLVGTRVLCSTPAVPAPPFITSAAADAALVAKLREAISGALLDPETREARSMMLLDGVEVLPLGAYGRIVELEGEAIHRGYTELHATGGCIRHLERRMARPAKSLAPEAGPIPLGAQAGPIR
jgi:hypothetical protein